MQRSKRLYATYDIVSRQFAEKTWEAVNDEDAKRAFINEMKRAPEYVNPVHFQLHFVGTWDMIDGRLEGIKDKNNEFIMDGASIGREENNAE